MKLGCCKEEINLLVMYYVIMSYGVKWIKFWFCEVGMLLEGNLFVMYYVVMSYGIKFW